MSTTGTVDLTWVIDAPSALPTAQGVLDLEWRIFDTGDSTEGTLELTWFIAQSAQTMALVLDGAPTGLVGVLTVSLVTEEGDIVVIAPTASEIVEFPAGSGRYVATLPLPASGRYFVLWTDGTTTASALVIVQLSGFVVTLEDRSPPAREDGVPWFEVTLQESATRLGLWTDLETFVLSPVDTDPSAPLSRGFTSNNAILTDAFYRLVWVDEDGSVYEGNPE